MFKDFQTHKSKMSQEEEGNEVHLGLPCGRQKAVHMPDILSRKTFHHEEKLFSVYKLALTGSNLIISSVSHGSC